jgi:hypothetical protein
VVPVNSAGRRGSGSRRIPVRRTPEPAFEGDDAVIETDPTPYNPLDRLNLARSIEATLLQQDCHRLPLASAFNGAGVYAIYYSGDFAAYRPISSPECLIPIYVGKADPPGSRRGITDPGAAAGPALYGRIADHTESIEAATNLRIEDFRVRFLVVGDIFIGLGEQLLIQQFRPLWNRHVAGFGLHDPGAGRHGSKRSEWDELHPGRPWHPKMKQVTAAAELCTKIKAAFKSGEAATIEQMASTSPPVESIDTPLPEAPET